MLKFSVITATYNAATTLRQAAESVLAQDYPEVEYIIIDGGSTDGTVDLLRAYSSRLAYWISEPDAGIYDAFNKGVQTASGDYVYFLGADDCLCDSGVLSRVADVLDDTVDIFSAGVYVVNHMNLEQFVGNERARDANSFDGEMIPHQGMFVKTNLLKEHPFDISFRLVGDYNFFLTCYYDKTINFRYADFPVAYYSTGGMSASSGQLYWAECRRIWKTFHMKALLEKYKNADLQPRPNRFRVAIKACIQFLGLYPWYYRLVHGWHPHQCKNKICRWCGREG